MEEPSDIELINVNWGEMRFEKNKTILIWKQQVKNVTTYNILLGND